MTEPTPDEYALLERAAIMEFHGGMSREEAERKAREDIEEIARRGEQEELFR